MTYRGHEVLDKRVLVDDGCYRKTRYWLRGWYTCLPGARQINGITGRETVVDVQEIRPCVRIDVEDKE